MVKKLYKHEWAALGRVLIPMELILLCVSALVRLIQLFEKDHLVYKIVFGSSVFFLVVVNLVNLSLPLIMGVIRFYRNLFTSEGYLSFTLPVTPTAHLMVKLAAAFTFSVINGTLCLISVGLATFGEAFGEIMAAARYLLNLLNAFAGSHTILFILEFLLLLVIAFCTELLLFYACICLGQLFRKNRVLAACGVYFAYYVITQIVSTVCSVVFGLLAETPFMGQLFAFAEKNPLLTVHFVLGGVLLLSFVLGILWFVVCRIIMRKKLNLE